MTNEEMQKAMEFIVNQQAQTFAQIEALSEAQREAHNAAEERRKQDEEQRKQNEERWKRSEERWERTEDGIRSLLAIAEIHEREIAALGENWRATDERLNSLIHPVERQS